MWNLPGDGKRNYIRVLVEARSVSGGPMIASRSEQFGKNSSTTILQESLGYKLAPTKFFDAGFAHQMLELLIFYTVSEAN